MKVPGRHPGDDVLASASADCWCHSHDLSARVLDLDAVGSIAGILACASRIECDGTLRHSQLVCDM